MRMGRITPSFDAFRYRLKDLVMDDTGRAPYPEAAPPIETIAPQVDPDNIELADTGRIPFNAEGTMREHLDPALRQPVPARSGEPHVREYLDKEEPINYPKAEREPEDIILDGPSRF